MSVEYVAYDDCKQPVSFVSLKYLMFSGRKSKISFALLHAKYVFEMSQYQMLKADRQQHRLRVTL